MTVLRTTLIDALAVETWYPFSAAYSAPFSSATPNPGCQRRSWAGRWE